MQIHKIHSRRQVRRQAHGGSLARGARKTKRPLCMNRSVHVVMRSAKAKGYRTLNNNRSTVESVIWNSAKLFNVRVYSFALNHNHIHLSVRAFHRSDIQNFFRVLAGHIAQRILLKFPLPKVLATASLGSSRGPRKYRRKFWDDLVFTRIVCWGRGFEIVLNYIELNRKEADGLVVRRRSDRGKT